MDKQIQQKLLDNNLFFSVLEKTYLIYNEELRKEVIDTFKKNKKTVSEEFYDFVSFFISREIDLFENSEDIKLDFLKCELSYAYDGPSTMVDCLKGTDNKVYVKELKDIYESVKTDFDLANITVFNNPNISALISENRLDVINFESAITPTDMDEYVNMIIGHINEVHPVMFIYISKKYLESNSILFEEEFVSKMNKLLANGVPQDLINLINGSDPQILKKFHFFVNKLDYTARFQIYDLLFDNGIYLFADEMLGFNLIGINDLRRKLIDDMKTNDYSYKSFMSFFPEDKLDKIDDDEFISALVETGNIERLLRSKYFVQYQDRIKKHIDESDPAYIDKINRKEICCVEGDVSIIEAVLKNPDAKVVHLFEGDIFRSSIQNAVRDSLEKDPSREIIATSEAPCLKLFEIFVSTNSVENIRNYFKQHLSAFIGSNKSIANAVRPIKRKNPELYEELFLEYFNNEKLSSINRKSSLRNLFLEDKKYRDLIFLREYLNKNLLFATTLEPDALNHYLSFITVQKKLKKQNVEALRSVVGNELLSYVEDENIIELLRLDEESFGKIMALFSNRRYTLDDLNASYDNIKQYEFSIRFSPIVDCYAILLSQIQRDSVDKNLIHDIVINLNSSFFEMFEKHFNTELDQKYKRNPRKFLELIVYKIKTGDSAKYSKILKYIADYYIDRKREEYKKTYNVKKDIGLEETIDENSAKQVIFNYFLERDVTLPDEKSFVNLLIEKCHQKGYSDDLIGDLIKFNKDKKVKLVNEHSSVVSKMFEFRLLGGEIITKYMNEYPSWYEDLREGILSKKKDELKKEYSPGKSCISVFKILSNIRLDVFKGILNNDYYYEKLKEVFAKRKLHKLPFELVDYIDNNNYLDFEIGERQIAAFMSYFVPIFRKEEEERKKKKNVRAGVMTLSSIFRKTKGYSRTSDIYSQILTPYDAKLIEENPGMLSAHNKLQNNQRLKESVDWTLKCFERMAVTVPTFNKVYKAGPTNMRAVVGNFTNPCNLTHGERVDSCMRVGGVGEGLYEYCMGNVNGFHIRFEDALTGEYAGRVSGFRNGNSVFLNELTLMPEDKIPNVQFLVNVLYEVAKDMVVESSASEYPIDNVFISNTQGFSNEEPHHLQVDSIYEGMESFYTTIKEYNAVVLASTSYNRPFEPLNFSKKNLPMYLPARDNVRYVTNHDEMLNVVNRIYTVKLALDGVPFEYISSNASGYLISLVSNIDNVIYFVCNNDWYYCVCSDGRIYQDFIDIDKRAVKELLDHESAYKQGNVRR